MGSSLDTIAKCSPLEKESNELAASAKSLAMGSTIAKTKEPKRKNGESAEDTDEFISQYGSHFSVSREDSECSHSSSYSSHSRTYTYDDEESLSYSVHSYSSSSMRTPVPSEPASPSNSDSPYKLFDGSCVPVGIHSCEATQRIITALQWHSLSVSNHNNHKLFLQLIKGSGYNKSLIDDYEHIISRHLLNRASIQSEAKREISKPCGRVLGHKCVTLERFQHLSTNELSQCDEDAICLYFIDLIHCYIFHSHAQSH